MPSASEREGVKGGEDAEREEDHVGVFPLPHPIEIEKEDARKRKPHSARQPQERVAEPGQDQTQARGEQRASHRQRTRRDLRPRADTFAFFAPAFSKCFLVVGPIPFFSFPLTVLFISFYLF